MKKKVNHKIIFAIASDHGGFLLKETLVKKLRDLNYIVFDLGVSKQEKCDYGVFAKKVCHYLKEKKATYGILCCTSGVGMNIIANRFLNIRALRCQNNDQALVKISKKHNNINVLTFGGKFVTPEKALQMIDILVKTEFSNLPRYQRRIKFLDQL